MPLYNPGVGAQVSASEVAADVATQAELDAVLTTANTFTADQIMGATSATSRLFVGRTLGIDNYAGIQHAALAVNTGNYALAQGATGKTIVNAASGQQLVLGVNNTDQVTLETSKIGFYGTAPISKPTGVAVSDAGIHAALVALGLIAA